MGLKRRGSNPLHSSNLNLGIEVYLNTNVMKTYIISFVTEQRVVMLNYCVQARSLMEAMEEIEHPAIVLSVVILIPDSLTNKS